MQNYNLSPEMIQALTIIRVHPVKYGTLLVTCNGVGYGGIARDVWKELIAKGWIGRGKFSRMVLASEAAYYLENGKLPPTLAELNICKYCKGSKGWQGEKYFVTCQRCNGDGLYHG